MSDLFDLTEPPTFDNTSRLGIEPSWINELNPEQKKAVLQTEGPLLVLSGAGTGKTRVLTSRLGYILAKNLCQPWNCLVVTFTNRAANEMKNRTFALVGDMAASVWLGTFHSICAKILRIHAPLVGLKSNFIILGEDDQKRMVKQIEEDFGMDIAKYPPQAIVDHISLAKDKGLSLDKIINKNSPANLVYAEYQKRLKENNCADFGDLLLYCIEIFTKNEQVLAHYQEQFKYIMVDEYQDTNVTQYLLLRLLSQKHHNICCVGDDDQSIYSWRGAEIENILRFEKDFSNAKIIRLERNYRSTANILSAASCLIAHNQGRLGKNLMVAENSPAKHCSNQKIKLVSVYSGEDEASYIAEQVESLRRSQTAQYSDMAVLVRTAFQTREMEEKFIAENIPYQVIGGPKFYERAEIRDALAYLRITATSDDNLAFERIINKPARGIGAKTLEKFKEFAKNRHISLFAAVEAMLISGQISGKAQNKLSALIELFNSVKADLNNIPCTEVANRLLEDSGYLQMLRDDKSPDAEGRIENLNELINVLSDTDRYPSLQEFLEHVSLVMSEDDNFDDNKVMLMTLHAAKGLEFDIVFLPGWEEGLFPHQKSLDANGSSALEEERRLAYVAITRAKKLLYISTAMNRRIYGQWQNNLPSRFINELPPTTLEICNQANLYFKQNYGNYKQNYWLHRKKKAQPTQSYNEDRYSYESSSEDGIGAKVFHQTFGMGKILAIDGNKVEVLFENCGKKKVMANFLKKCS